MNQIEEMLKSDKPTVVADTEGNIVKVNSHFLEAFSWQEKALLGGPLTIIIPEKFHDAHNLSFSRFLSTGKSSIFKQWIPLEIVCGGGDVQVANHFILACYTSEGKFLVAHIIPEQ